MPLRFAGNGHGPAGFAGRRRASAVLTITPLGGAARGAGAAWRWTDLSKNAGCGDRCARFPTTFVIGADNGTLARRSKAGRRYRIPAAFT
jgi:hypothetical protein